MEENGAAVQQGLCVDLRCTRWRQDYRRSRAGPSCVFVRAKFECAGNLPRGRELLCKARVYVYKPDQLAKQSSSRSYEEYSC